MISNLERNREVVINSKYNQTTNSILLINKSTDLNVIQIEIPKRIHLIILLTPQKLLLTLERLELSLLRLKDLNTP